MSVDENMSQRKLAHMCKCKSKRKKASKSAKMRKTTPEKTFSSPFFNLSTFSSFCASVCSCFCVNTYRWSSFCMCVSMHCMCTHFESRWSNCTPEMHVYMQTICIRMYVCVCMHTMCIHTYVCLCIWYIYTLTYKICTFACIYLHVCGLVRTCSSCVCMLVTV